MHAIWPLFAFGFSVFATLGFGPERLAKSLAREHIPFLLGVIGVALGLPVVAMLATPAPNPENLWLPTLLLGIEACLIASAAGVVFACVGHRVYTRW